MLGRSPSAHHDEGVANPEGGPATGARWDLDGLAVHGHHHGWRLTHRTPGRQRARTLSTAVGTARDEACACPFLLLLSPTPALTGSEPASCCKVQAAVLHPSCRFSKPLSVLENPHPTLAEPSALWGGGHQRAGGQPWPSPGGAGGPWTGVFSLLPSNVSRFFNRERGF